MFPFSLSLFVAGDHVSSQSSSSPSSLSLPLFHSSKEGKKNQLQKSTTGHELQKGKTLPSAFSQIKKEKDIVWEPFPCRLTGKKKGTPQNAQHNSEIYIMTTMVMVETVKTRRDGMKNGRENGVSVGPKGRKGSRTPQD